MDKLDNLEKLKEKFNISYEQAKIALEFNDWDMLDAELFLEYNNIIEKPEEGIFFTNTIKSKYTEGDSISNNLVKVDVKENRDNTFFENICDLIDKANNIIFEIIKGDKVYLKLPSTIVIILLFFSFSLIIPLAIVGLFFDLKYRLRSNQLKLDKINNVFMKIESEVRKLKDKIKQRRKV